MSMNISNLKFHEISKRVQRFLIRGIEPSKPLQAPRAQTREPFDSPFSTSFSAYQPLKFNLDLYDVIRETIPILDEAVVKKTNLIGSFRLDALGNDNLQKLLDYFYDRIQVGWFGHGFHECQTQIVDSAIAKGMGWFEVVPQASMRGIHRLKVARANDLRFIRKDGQLFLGQVTKDNIEPQIIENQDLVHYLAFDQRDGHPQGHSLFYSLPFMSQIFVRIAKAIDNHIWRAGDPTFFIIVKGDSDGKLSDTTVGSLASAVQTDVTNIMADRRQGKVGDLFAGVPYGGNIEVKVLGADAEIMSLEIPTHTILEQLISRTGLPPFMFGLYKWQSTERMSTHQNDMIVARVENERIHLDPIIEKTVDTFLILSGNAGAKWKHEWEPVNLLDETEKARANQLNASAAEKYINILEKMVMYGWIDEVQELDQYLEERGIKQLNGEYIKKRIERIEERMKYMRAGNILKTAYGVEAIIPTNGKEKSDLYVEELVG
jgi:hypothetical protein